MFWLFFFSCAVAGLFSKAVPGFFSAGNLQSKISSGTSPSTRGRSRVGYNAGLSRRRSRVQVPSLPPSLLLLDKRKQNARTSVRAFFCFLRRILGSTRFKGDECPLRMTIPFLCFYFVFASHVYLAFYFFRVTPSQCGQGLFSTSLIRRGSSENRHFWEVVFLMIVCNNV